ncbi:MAG: (d)CMP kinase [Clostridia bacterium]|nr:(d)CMP kinase [Clostridia bacterium]
MSNIVIGIEGLVGAGKTAICRELLNQIPNSILLQGGNLYRAVAYSLLQSGINIEELKQNMQQVDIKSVMEKLKIEFKIENRDTVVYVDGKKIEEEDLQSASSSLAVSEISKVANNQNLYVFGRQVIDQLKKQFNVIVSGRDLMHIYPNLDYHFLITASLEERIRRKGIQYKGKMLEEDIKQNIIKRDELQEKAGFYKQYEKTMMIDVTNCKTVEDSANEVLKHIKS